MIQGEIEEILSSYLLRVIMSQCPQFGFDILYKSVRDVDKISSCFTEQAWTCGFDICNLNILLSH